MAFEFGVSELISGLALVVAGYVALNTRGFRKAKRELIKLQKDVQALILKRERREAEKVINADLGASLVTVGSKKHQLRIFNTAQAAAYQVKIAFPEGNEMIPVREIEELFPLQVLEGGASVNLPALVTLGTGRKLALELSWKNADGEQHNKAVLATR